MNYLIGLNGILFEIANVKKIYVIQEEDLVEVYNTLKEKVFICNKMDIDFIMKWEEGEEIPKALMEKYNIEESSPNVEDNDGPNEEPTTEEPTTEEPTDGEPTDGEPTDGEPTVTEPETPQ